MDAFFTKRSLAVALAIVTVALLVAVSSALAAASITVTPSQIKAGDTVVARGEGFPANEAITLTVNLGGMTVPAGTVTADARGAFEFKQTVPSIAPPGELTIEAVSASGVKASAKATIVKAGEATPRPAATATPASTPQAEELPASGGGMPPWSIALWVALSVVAAGAVLRRVARRG